MSRLTEYHCGVAVIKDKGKLKDAMQKLANYEDLEEQGLLLKVPCKVGDIAHQIMFIPKKEKTEIVEGIVEEVAYKHAIGYSCMIAKVRNADHTMSIWDDYDFGKYVFLIKAEAEAALAEMKEKEN